MKQIQSILTYSCLPSIRDGSQHTENGGLALAVRHVAKCENKTHVAKEMPHTFATVAKRFF